MKLYSIVRAVLCLFLSMIGGQAALAATEITVDPTAVTGHLAEGRVVDVAFSVSTDAGEAIFGVEFDVATASSGLRIAGVEVAPGFGRVVDQCSEPLPAAFFRAGLLQPRDDIDAALGANGIPTALITVRLEIMTSQPFVSALKVQARAALVGGVATDTAVLGGTQAADGWAAGEIRVVSLGPEDPQLRELTLTLRPLGGGDPVTVLDPYTAYELHYATTYPNLGNFVVFFVGPDETTCPQAATPPPSGPWSDAMMFSVLDIPAIFGAVSQAPGYPNGFERYTMISNALPAEADPAGNSGHLCNITTGAAGELHSHAYLWFFDPDTETLILREILAYWDVSE